MHPELQIRKRMLLLTGIIGALFLVVVCRIWQLTVPESAALTARGVKQWTKEGVVTARRGNITDRHNNVLALSSTAYMICADPRLVSDETLLVDTLETVLPLNRETVLARLRDKTKGSVILKRQVSRDTADKIRRLRTESAAETGLRAITFDEDTRRWYPYGQMLAQVLGLTNVDSLGQSGLETQFESVLAGQEGRYLRQVDARNRALAGSESLYVPSRQGATLKLTVDSTIQQICERAMRECIAVNEAASVLCIVSDVRTGEILAMCMKPDYDPNDPPRNDVQTLNGLMRITAVSDVYEPGSTFKILTAAAALDSGVTTPEDPFYCSAKIRVSGDTIRCWGSAHGAQTMAEGLQNSCNPVFVELALRMGTDTFYRYLTAFGLGKKTGIPLPGESAGILIGARYVKDVDLARIGFGQSVAVTPLQLMMAANSVVNGGKLMKPCLVSEILTPEGEVLQRFHPEVTATPIRAETSAVMRTLLEHVVADGGGKNARVAGYRIGGKTGTAQVYRDGRIVRDVHIGSFYGFAPANDPLISVLVVVNEAQVPVDYGGTTAAPFAAQILESTLQYLQVPPDNGEDLAEVLVPDLTGLTIAQARRMLAQSGLEILTDGVNDVALDQLPPAGTRLKEGGHVMVYTVSAQEITPETLVCVPDVTGMSDVDCARLLRQRGLKIQTEGTGLCSRQSPAGGEYAAPGTCVKVVLTQPESAP